MAVLTRREVVCDLGMEKCDNTTLHRARVTVDGKTRSWVLCDKHVKPMLPFLDNATKVHPRAKVYSSIAEVRREKAAKKGT